MTVEVGNFNIQEPFHSGRTESALPERTFGEKSSEANSENISHTTTNALELLVAVRPSNKNSTEPSIDMTNHVVEHTLISPHSIVTKRPLVSNLPNGPTTARVPSHTNSPLLFVPTNQKLLTRSAGSTLQSAIKRVQNNLSQSCFAEIHSNRGTDIDNDLTCLNWLQEGNLLNGFSPKKEKIDQSFDEEKEQITESKDFCKNQDLQLSLSYPLSTISEVDKSLRKPAYSFSTLIFMAIENAKDKRLPVKEIYQWIQDNFPYFQKAPIGWKNSVRHNLSLNKSFKKVDKEKCIGKGSLWTIDHEARAGLVQQLRKTATYQSYSRLPYRFCTKERPPCKRDSSGRFVANHDESEFDVAATMCSLSSPASFYRNFELQKNIIEQQQSSLELLTLWRKYIEPKEDEEEIGDEEMDLSCKEGSFDQKRSPSNYTIEDFLNEVHNKLSIKGYQNNRRLTSNSNHRTRHLNMSMDEDYEFYDTDDESSDEEDEEMKENMRRLVEKEKDDGLANLGYSEVESLKCLPMLDHSYSKSIHSLCKPQSRRESKGVAALLSLANAASRELESLSKIGDEHISINSTDTALDCAENIKKRPKSLRTKSLLKSDLKT